MGFFVPALLHWPEQERAGNAKETSLCQSSTASPTCTTRSRNGGGISTPIRNCATRCIAPLAAVAEKLKSFGCDEVVPGIGRTGVVGVIRGRKPVTNPATGRNRIIGLRADMDALPVEEETGLPYKSTVPGKMHACGHDGHTAMLLGAAKYLAETRNFVGTAVVIFPAGRGGRRRRAGHAQGRADQALRHRRILRHAQLSGLAGRPIRYPSGPDDGRRRPSRD